MCDALTEIFEELYMDKLNTEPKQIAEVRLQSRYYVNEDTE